MRSYRFKFLIVISLFLFSTTGVSGRICVNGKPISTSSERFRQLSCYIHQDDLHRPQLTVGEIMILAAHLKLGFKVTKEHKLSLVSVDRICQTFRISNFVQWFPSLYSYIYMMNTITLCRSNTSYRFWDSSIAIMSTQANFPAVRKSVLPLP